MKRTPFVSRKTLSAAERTAIAGETRGTAAKLPTTPHEPAFRQVITLIQRARQRAFHAVNTELIDLYWRVGEYISHKLEAATWGEGVVDQLARFIARREPEIKGFTRRNLFRMRQFYETYRREKKLSPLVRELPWTHTSSS